MEFLSGNEAIARGAWEAGCHIGTAYPGTPSTETMETFATLPGVYAEWCPNEKVALEVAMGASAAGARVLVTMKHVGVNVCADPLFTASYTGVNGGVLLLAADDPGMFSSQNEQDSRYYAMASLVPILEPADSQEALDFARSAYDLSEQFDVPFMMRSTVRISHTKTPVEVGERTEVEKKPYETDPTKWVMMPAFAKPRRKVVVKRTETLKEWVETCPFNRVEKGDTSIGIICAGAVYEHVKEALGDVSIFKLGVTWPLPADALARFAESVDKVYVVEEASTYLSDAVRSCGIALDEFVNPLPADGEVHPEDILHAFGKTLRTSILLAMFPIVRLLFVRAALIVSSSVSWRAIRLSSRAISAAIRSAPCRRSQLWIPRSTWAPPFRWRMGSSSRWREETIVRSWV